MDAITEIESFTNSLNFEEFQADQKTVKAVLYDMAIIGEAARNIPPEVEAGFSEIPWAEVRGMRNVVIYEYFRVNLEIVWQTIQEDLMPLALSLWQLLL